MQSIRRESLNRWALVGLAQFGGNIMMAQLYRMKELGVEVPWTWERECRGPSLKKVSKKSPGAFPYRCPKGRKEVSKKVRKAQESENGVWRLFGPFSRLFRTFETQWPEGPRRLS